MYSNYINLNAFRIESYSCKMIGTEKVLYKRYNARAENRSPHSLEALSPPSHGYGGYSLSPGSTNNNGSFFNHHHAYR